MPKIIKHKIVYPHLGIIDEVEEIVEDEEIDGQDHTVLSEEEENEQRE